MTADSQDPKPPAPPAAASSASGSAAVPPAVKPPAAAPAKAAGPSDAELPRRKFMSWLGVAWMAFTASMAYGKNRSPTSSLEVFRYTTYGASAGLKLPLGRHMIADGGYSYFRSSQVEVPVDSHTVSVSLAYRFEPR